MSIICLNTKRILHRMYSRATGAARVNHFLFDFYHRQAYSQFYGSFRQFLQSAPCVTVRDCASIAGHIMSMAPVLGNLTRRKTRFLYKGIDFRFSWDSRFNIGLHSDCLSEIFFGKTRLFPLILEP